MTDALQRRLEHLRTSVLFSALAGEAYANELADELLDQRDADALDRLATPDKLLVVTRLAGLGTVLEWGRNPFQRVHRLFQVRNALVHPKRSSPTGYVINAGQTEDDAIGPLPAAQYVLAVGQVMEAIDPLRPPPPVLFRPARLLVKYPGVVESLVKDICPHITNLPREDAARPSGLFERASQREAKAVREAEARQEKSTPAE